MAGFTHYGNLVDEIDAGKRRIYSWRKTPTQVTVSGNWFDLSMSPGNPVPNYYAATPLVAQVLNGNEGIFHGGNVTPDQKFLKEFLIVPGGATGLPSTFILMDYLLYYPFIDQGNTDLQPMDNTIVIPRYTSGAGVKIMAVVVGSQAGGCTFTVTYTNQAGTTGRVTPTITCNTATATGSIATSSPATANLAGPFLPLQGTDTGVQKIESVTMLTPDVGLLTLVLVKPIATFCLRGVDAPVEVDYLKDTSTMPVIVDGAYLNLVVLPTGSLSAIPLHGLITTVWS